MNNFFKVAIVLALTGITQVASSHEEGNFDLIDENFSIQRENTEDRQALRPEAARYRWYSAGEARTNKVIKNEFTFQSRLNNRVDRLRLVGTRSGVIIRSVIVEYRNGRTEELRRLEGRLRKGQRMVVNLSGDRRIKAVRVIATSESLIGSRGTFRVELGVWQ